MNLYHHIRQLIVQDLGMTFVPTRMKNDDSDTECVIDVDSGIYMNDDEEVNGEDDNEG